MTRPERSPSGARPTPKEPSLYFNRELSWLAFNQRVLEEAADPHWPLLERLKFLAITFSNLDEFFMIRVSGLHEQLEQAEAERSPDGLTPRQQLARIREVVRALLKDAMDLLERELLPGLAEHGIRIREWKSLGKAAQERARTYFREAVFPVLTPLAVDPGHPFPFISNLSLSLAVEAADPDSGERRFARVKVPEILPRFVPLERFSDSPDEARPGEFLPLEALISANLDQLFPGMQILGVYPFRITRDMDMEIMEEEAHDLLVTIDREIRRRKFGAVVRLEVHPDTPQRIREFLLAKLEIEEDDLYEESGALGASALIAVAMLPRADLHDVPFVQTLNHALAEAEDPFAVVRMGDILLHHPYDSFQPVLHFLRRAAEDPAVLAIKMTLYRTGSNSEIVKALSAAAENGKQVAVAIELKARFDEQNNIVWARQLERAGVHVFYGSVGLKTHAKVILVVRREDAQIRRYVHLSTGNYNVSTSRLYTDLGMFSADQGLGEDVSEVFNALSGFAKVAHYRKLAVAPVTLADTVLRKISEQTELARAGKPARIYAKMNALVDLPVIDALYQASQAGCRVDLCIRGICCLRPGLPGVSENIRVFSIVGRFLEHCRVFLFGAGEQEELFLASADWMPRNLYRRVELMFPVEDRALRARIHREVIEPSLIDNTRARDLRPDGTYVRRLPAPGEPVRDAQLIVLEPLLRQPLRAVQG
ncbi:MAG TPA: polyphosphate kinase 1 [Myxococcaceae bacterium]|nr:polyphosphate kinase 1 [Myxococcaceae bacterium]